MEIKQELMVALKQAMQERDTIKKDTITMLRAAILQVEKDDQRDLSQQDIQTIVAREIKKRKDSIADYERGQRQDIIDQINTEIEILSKYLPKQLSEQEIFELVTGVISQTGAQGMKDMGKVMAALREKTAGKADGKVVSDVVKMELAKL